MWTIQILWKGCWITVDQGYKSQDDAEWATGQWKAENKCYGDPFRATQIEQPANDQQAIDLVNQILAQEAEEFGGEG